MSLKFKVEAEIKEAMLKKQKDKLRALRAIKSLILLAETEKGSTHELNEESENKLLQRAAKQRKDSLEIFQKQGRDDLAEIERAELDVIHTFLPKQMTEDEIEQHLLVIIKEHAMEGIQNLGKLMGMATKQLAGKADGKQISAIAKKLLG